VVDAMRMSVPFEGVAEALSDGKAVPHVDEFLQ
jgi:hypothetical protein